MSEKRFYATEVRAKKNGNKKTVGGYAARYGVRSGEIPIGDGNYFYERIERGAFKRILGTNPDVVCTVNHDSNVVLGRTASGTLRLRENDNGLEFEVDLPSTTAGNDTYESVQRGDLNAMSFAFTVQDERMCHYSEEEFEEDEEGIRGKVKRTVKVIVRTIRDFADLIDVAIVTRPAYPQTSVDPRNMLVAAEVRSRVEAYSKPKPVMSQAQLEQMRYGLSFEDRIEIRDRNRRRELLDF